MGFEVLNPNSGTETSYYGGNGMRQMSGLCQLDAGITSREMSKECFMNPWAMGMRWLSF